MFFQTKKIEFEINVDNLNYIIRKIIETKQLFLIY